MKSCVENKSVRVALVFLPFAFFFLKVFNQSAESHVGSAFTFYFDLIIVMARKCCGVTRAGRTCSITSASTLTDNRGRSVGSPLVRGGDYCIFHARPFCSHPVKNLTEPFVSLFLDLEASGTDPVNDRILELSAVQCLSGNIGASFSTVVCVDDEILSTPTAQQAAEVHGIPPDEIGASPRFAECWQRFLSFIHALLNDAIHEDISDSSDEDATPVLPRPPERQPTLVLAAHNGLAFDFPMLLSECYRHDLDLTVFDNWVYVDTLHVVKAAKRQVGECVKLQCLGKNVCTSESLQAHRGRDDCVVLVKVMYVISVQLGCPLFQLLSMFAQSIQMSESLAQVSALITD